MHRTYRTRINTKEKPQDKLIRNEYFELGEELTPDLEVALIARNSDISLKDKEEKFAKLLPFCSEEMQEGMKRYIAEKKNNLTDIKKSLNEGYVLFPTPHSENEYPFPQIFTSVEDFIEYGVNTEYTLIKIGEKSKSGSIGYGRVAKNDDDELTDVAINRRKFESNYQAKPNPLFEKEILLKNKFERFDIITVPTIDEYMVVIEKEDAVESVCEVDKGPYLLDLYCCRLRNGWDFDHDIYYVHVLRDYVLEPYYEKVEYDDAPADIRKLVDYLKKNKQKSSKEA